MKDVIIIGGGLAGLINAIQLADAGLEVTVIEKKEYPFHRVCGEYISNEALPFLKRIGADPEFMDPARITQLWATSTSGTRLRLPLKMGGFGISRYTFDNFLYSVAMGRGVQFILNTAVTDYKFDHDRFWVKLSTGKVEESALLIGGFGKRSNIDRILNREFFIKRSPYVGVKYHIQTDFPENVIALHNFKDGYCGISKIERKRYCLCYLTSRENLQNAGNIPALEENVLYKNPWLKDIFQNSEFLYDSPEVINEISFEQKSVVDNHLLMTGDAAGMITPLCGNGMAMAIHSAKILSSLIILHYRRTNFDRQLLEKEYAFIWKRMFEKRLNMGRRVQQLFGKEIVTEMAIRLLKTTKPLGNWMVRQTHGEVF